MVVVVVVVERDGSGVATRVTHSSRHLAFGVGTGVVVMLGGGGLLVRNARCCSLALLKPKEGITQIRTDKRRGYRYGYGYKFTYPYPYP